MPYLFNDHDMRLIEDGTRVYGRPLTDTIMHKATPDIEMQMKIIYSFKSEIHKGGRGIIVYEKIKCSTEILTILKDFIDQCEMK